jgi:hypothetical protein
MDIFVFNNVKNIDETKFDSLEFENFFDCCAAKCEYHFKKICIDNHFSYKSQKDFNNIVDKNITMMLGIIMGMARNRFKYVDILFQIGKKNDICGKIETILKDCLVFARENAIAVHEQDQEVKKNYDKIASHVIGLPYDLKV